MDNKFYGIDISKFDPTNASAAEIRKWLFAIIDAELEKDPDERDYDLIKECSDFEAELPLSDTDIELSESDYVAGLERIKAQTSATEHKETKILKPKKKTKKSVRIIAILAASLATLILSLTVAAAVQGVSLWQFVSENFRNILCMDSGDKLSDEEITLYKNGELFYYSSIEDAICSIDPDMLCPTYLPAGVKIEKIAIADIDNNESKVITYITNESNLFIETYPTCDSLHTEWENATLYETEFIVFYVIKTVDCSYQAVGWHNEMRYSIKYNNYDELLNILNGIKEIGK